jgi:hypothetical protein
MPCTEYCLLTEGPEKAGGRCVCPDCTGSAEEDEEVLNFVENNETNWPGRIYCVLFILMTVAFFTEIKFGWTSKFG